MEATVRRSIISGKCKPPVSIPAAHRAVALASLTPEQSVISDVPKSLQLSSTIRAAESLGASIAAKEGVLDIIGVEKLPSSASIDCGDSRATLMLLMPVFAAGNSQADFSGTGILSKFPLEAHAGYLSRLGATAKVGANGGLPISVSGPFAEAKMVFFPRLGTDFFAGLLFSSFFCAQDMEIGIEGRFSDMESWGATISLMEKFGVAFEYAGDDYIMLQSAQLPRGQKLSVPPRDYHSAFLLACGAIGGRATLEGYSLPKTHAQLFESFGASVHVSDNKTSVSAGSLSGCELDAGALGNLVFLAAALAAHSDGETHLKNLPSLSRRHSNHLRSLLAQLSRLGVKSEESGVELHIKGGKLTGAQVDCGGSPSVAMALSLAGISASTPVTISGTECLSRTYPGFFRDLASLGAIIR